MLYPHRARTGRLVATVALAVATVLLVLAHDGMWWETQVNLSVQKHTTDPTTSTATLAFYLDGSIRCSTSEWSRVGGVANPCTNASSQLTGSSRLLYFIVNYLDLFLLAVCVGAAGLGAAGQLGVRRNRRQLEAFLALALVVSVALGGVVVGSAVAGPPAAGQTTCSSWTAGASSCSTFWGVANWANSSRLGCTDCRGAQWLNWGAGTAYGDLLGAGILAWVASVFLLRYRKAPFTYAEEALWARENRPYTLVGPERPGGPEVEPFVPRSEVPPPPPDLPLDERK